MAGYSDDDSYGEYSDGQHSTGGYPDEQHSTGGYSDDQYSAGEYSDDQQSAGEYSDDQHSTEGYSDDQYSAEGYSDDERLSAGGYSDSEEQDFDDDQDASGGYYNPVTATKEYDYSGKQTTPYYEPRPREQSSSYQRTAKASYMDKHTGDYIRTTAKDVISSGETFKERGSAGRVGTKNEYTTTKTFRAGDKRGYSEYQVQERFRRFDYGGNNNSSSKGYYSGGSSKKYLK